MLVEGVCDTGHSLLCVMTDGKVRGAMARGGLRITCPDCGGSIAVHLESAVLPVARPSELRLTSENDDLVSPPRLRRRSRSVVLPRVPPPARSTRT